MNIKEKKKKKKEDKIKELLRFIKDTKSINTNVDRKSVPNNLQDKLIVMNLIKP